MQHRHLQTSRWTRAAIDSAIEYGDLPDWRELLAAARADLLLADEVRQVSIARPQDGASLLMLNLIDKILQNSSRAQ